MSKRIFIIRRLVIAIIKKFGMMFILVLKIMNIKILKTEFLLRL